MLGTAGIFLTFTGIRTSDASASLFLFSVNIKSRSAENKKYNRNKNDIFKH